MNADFGKKFFFIPTLATLVALFFMVFSSAAFADDAPPPEPGESTEVAHDGDEEDIITADLLMPETVCAYSSFRSYPELVETWKTTQWGRMFALPEMQPAQESFRQQLHSQYSELESRLGVAMTDIFEIASGEIASAALLLPPPEDMKQDTAARPHAGMKTAMAVLIDVHGREVESQKVLTKIAKRVTDDGGKHMKQQLANADVHYLDIVRSAPAKDPKAAKAPAAASVSRVIYVLKDNWLLASDDKDVIRAILERMEAIKTGETLPCLADVTGYYNVLERCMGDSLPDMVWYLDPVRYAVVGRIRQLEKDAKNTRSQDYSVVLRESGFDGVEAIGGFITLKTEGHECVVRTFISIPKPPTRSLKMLKFPAGNDFQPPVWVPDDVSGCLVLNVDYMTLFDNLGPIFNQFYGEGDDGVWDDVLEGLRDDPYGPRVDLRNDIFTYFGSNVCFFVQNEQPKLTDGERRMMAIPLKKDDAPKVVDALARLLEKEDGIRVELTEDGKIWTYAKPAGRPGAARGNNNRQPLFPEMAITVRDGYLLIASHREFLAKIDFKKQAGLGASEKYQRVTDELNKFVGTERSSQDYFDMETQYHHLFLMFKDGTLPKSTAISARMINGMFSDPDAAGARKPLLDAKDLPSYDVLRPYFAPGGSALTEVDKGFLLEGIYLSAEGKE